MMSFFMLGFAVAPRFYGPVSDRYGRKPVVAFACMLFSTAGIGCALAQSLLALRMWRILQGAGAGAGMTIALAIICDLFEGQAARTKLVGQNFQDLIFGALGQGVAACSWECPVLALPRHAVTGRGSPLSIQKRKLVAAVGPDL